MLAIGLVRLEHVSFFKPVLPICVSHWTSRWLLMSHTIILQPVTTYSVFMFLFPEEGAVSERILMQVDDLLDWVQVLLWGWSDCMGP